MKFSRYGKKHVPNHQSEIVIYPIEFLKQMGTAIPKQKVQDGQIHWVNLPSSSDHGQQTRKKSTPEIR